ncbi:MAG: hypothetical protein WD607_00290 [Candidatus Paceibacterota bacterium]
MRLKEKLLLAIFFLAMVTYSCESEVERKERVVREEQYRIELEEKRIAEEAERATQLEQERIARETILEKERQERAIYEKYINNSLNTGSTPYAYCYGRNTSCTNYGCSDIEVKTPSNSDVIVTIKKGETVVRHAYIKAGSSYTFELLNGTYQPYFYYGKGWNPNKVMKQTDCGILKGGFITNENFGKDSPQSLSNNILQYELILQQNGNFSMRPSNPAEAF